MIVVAVVVVGVEMIESSSSSYELFLMVGYHSLSIYIYIYVNMIDSYHAICNYPLLELVLVPLSSIHPTERNASDRVNLCEVRK